jgi:hypothetical protein
MQAISIPAELFEYGKLILPVLGVWIGFWLRGFENRAAVLQARVDDIIDETVKLVEAGSLYWRRDTTSAPKDAEDIALEAEIQGRSHAINELFEVIAASFRIDPTTQVRSCIVELRQSLTGRDFAALSGHVSSGQAISQAYTISSRLRVKLLICVRKRKFTFRQAA